MRSSDLSDVNDAQTELESSDTLTGKMQDGSEETVVLGADPLSLAQQKAINDPRFRWYIVNTYTGSEETVKTTLRERVERARLEDKFGEIFVPKMVVEKVLKSGKKKYVDKTTYPGYLIVQMELNDDTMGCVTSTPKVTGFVGNRRHPRPMPDSEVLRLLSPGHNTGEVASEKTVAGYKKGDEVKVIDGPFTNFDGVVDEVRPEKMKVKVLVSIFGRETPVELSFSQVKKNT